MLRGKRSRGDAGWRSWTDRERRRLSAGEERNCCRARYSRNMLMFYCVSHELVIICCVMFITLLLNVCLQTEDHELWATHFDSLQRRPPVLTAAPSAPPPALSNSSERGEWEPMSSLSLVWEATSSCGAESVGGASIDTTSGYPTRAK